MKFRICIMQDTGGSRCFVHMPYPDGLETLYGGCTDPLTKSVYFMQVIKFLRTAD